MVNGKYKNFSNRLIDAMKLKGYVTSRSPNGICMKTLSQFAGASEQICRRYIRGAALPDYDKLINIAACLNVLPGWLLFGEKTQSEAEQQSNDDLLQYILKASHHLYREESANDEYADFVLGLLRDIRKIDTSKANLLKIIDLAIDSISSYKAKQTKKII